ncbi:hypothetical protein [Ruminococcus sp.]|uniref:hypothetical protein n=1 Tax=Ruminococcus sp. TaxID=41978 RepID=UPI0025EC3CE9|nr:hypothetical protein [Ruminococcus sp.]MBQ6251556.1 hypothetical protein [Ruminococcus sp.]
MRKLIIVEGLPCSGKSTVSKHIAEVLGMEFTDEGSGSHPADYEFHAFLSEKELSDFQPEDRELISAAAEKRCGGYVVPIGSFSGNLFDRLLTHKIYDFLPWKAEKPLMLDKWRSFAESAASSAGHVFNCVFLQNPMCETMMRFGFDSSVSEGYIREIYDIILPLEPFVVYLKTDNIAAEIKKALPERGEEWLSGVIDYHCGGEYGKSLGLSGFEGYVSALEERQRRELAILGHLGIDSIVIENFKNDSQKAYDEIFAAISAK